jgi:hypothetical protein
LVQARELVSAQVRELVSAQVRVLALEPASAQERVQALCRD